MSRSNRNVVEVFCMAVVWVLRYVLAAASLAFGVLIINATVLTLGSAAENEIGKLLFVLFIGAACAIAPIPLLTLRDDVKP